MAIGGLGSGLDSLFSDNTTEVQVKKTLRITEIEPNREQPRKNFSDEAITALRVNAGGEQQECLVLTKFP